MKGRLVGRHQPFSAAAHLDFAIRSVGLSREAQAVFVDYPSLRSVALAYTRYVTPIIDLDDTGTNLLPLAIGKAIRAVVDHGRPGVFLPEIVDASKVLAQLQICVPNPKSTWWDIWDFDEPLMKWMRARDSARVRVGVRDTPAPEGQVILKLLANVATARDLRGSDLQISIR
jgi:hypothetical protein